MPTAVSRSSKACENCRRIKKRCRPPFPCASCASSGALCAVRSKARPLRLSKHRQIQDASATPEQTTSSDMPDAYFRLNSTLPEAHHSSFRGHDSHDSVQEAASDPFEIVYSLVAQNIPKAVALEDIRSLSEPQPSAAVVFSGQDPDASPTEYSMISNITLADINLLLDSHSSRIFSLELFDLSSLKDTAAGLFRCPTGALILGDINLRRSSVPFDHLSFLFAFLAASSLGSCEEQISQGFLEFSMQASNGYAKESTTALLSALFLQHLCILRTGTANRTRAVITNAIQVAQDLGIQQPGADTSPQSLRLYLLLCFSDQYCALSHNTAPCTRITDYTARVFEPLLKTDPRLCTLIRLVSLNSVILHKLSSQPYTYENVIDLESMMGGVCSSIGRIRPERWPDIARGELRYEILVQIHILWSRLVLRMPMIKSGHHWVASLGVCIRAAQMLLSSYFSITAPSIRVIAASSVLLSDESLNRSLREMVKLPPTWRQVHRMVTSALLMFYGLWKGEASDDEVGRSSAMALLLLEYERTRWDSSIDASARSIKTLASISEIQLRPHMVHLVPGADATFLDRVCADSKTSGRHRQPSPLVVNNDHHNQQHMPLNYMGAPLSDDAETEGNWMRLPFFQDILDSELLGDWFDPPWSMNTC